MRLGRRFVACLTSTLSWAAGAATLSAQQQFGGELVGEGVVSLPDQGETFPSLSADGEILYFSRVKDGRGWSEQQIMWARWDGDGWGEPQVLPFSDATASDRAPRSAPDDSFLIFSSNRALPGDGGSGEYNIWMVEQNGQAWGAPIPVPGALNSHQRDAHGSVAADGTIYFYSTRDGSLGRGDIWRSSASDGGYGEPVNLGPPVNSALSQPDLWISPSQEWMILVITDHPEGYGGDDLYLSEFRDGAWTEPVNLGPAVNTAEYEYGPFVDATGTWLYFVSHRTGGGDIYRIRLREVLR